jgi:outer membrane protein assembly factor BamB
MPVFKLHLKYLGLLGLVLIMSLSHNAAAQTVGDEKLYLPIVTRNFIAYSEWVQDGHDAQRTGYTPIEPKEPWTLLWTWNGPNASGGSSCTNNTTMVGHCYTPAREARTVAGGGAVYVPAGSRGLYALSKTNGSILWNVTGATFDSTPVYNGTYVFAGATNGNLYRVNAELGGVPTTYNAGGPIRRGILLVGNYVYALTESGVLHKVDVNTMTQVWTYTPEGNTSNTEGTGLAYSLSRDIILYGTNDLYVHAVNNNDGSKKWRVKPSPNTAGFPNQFLYYWPVVAEQNGVVFVRMRLDHNTGLASYPSGDKHIWPNSNAEARTWLNANQSKKSLFALNLDTGVEKFTPAVGYGGTEDLVNNQPFVTTGPVPVVKVWSGGQEVAYIHFRNGQSAPPDWRWDSHMGEMVLNNSTVSGLVAGDMRFVKMNRQQSGGYAYTYLTDEQNALTMAGTTLFHAHWGASESGYITNRSNSLGLSYSNPIQTTRRPPVIRRTAHSTCATVNYVTHYYTCGLNLYGDSRYWDGPLFWTYWNTWDPPTNYTSAYSDGMRTRYTYVSADIIVVQGNGGELMVFKHSGP